MMPAQDLALAQIAAAFAGDWAYLDTLYDPDVRYLDPDGQLIGRPTVVDRLRELADGLPDSRYEIRSCTGDGADRVVIEWSLLAAADPPAALDIATAYQFRDGRIVAERNYWDNLALSSWAEPTPAADRSQ